MRQYHVVCILGDGERVGECGHRHRTRMAAVLCPYEPPAFDRDDRAGLFVEPIDDARARRSL